MTSRLLLTLLALLTGLAAQAAPAHAASQPVRTAEVNAVLALSHEVRQNMPAGMAAVQPQLGHLRLAALGNGPAGIPAMITPAVRIGADRARE